MLRTIVFIVLVCVALMAGLTYCAPTKQGTLTLTPAPTFPDASKAELGRTVARIVPFCPGMSMVGKNLVFTNLESSPASPAAKPASTASGSSTSDAFTSGSTPPENSARNPQEQAHSVSITFTVPDSASMPAAWGSYDSPCVFRVEGDLLSISGPSCQAICLGKQPDSPQDVVRVNLNPKAQNKQ